MKYMIDIVRDIFTIIGIIVVAVSLFSIFIILKDKVICYITRSKRERKLRKAEKLIEYVINSSNNEVGDGEIRDLCGKAKWNLVECRIELLNQKKEKKEINK